MYIDSSSAISEKKKTELFKFAGQQDYLSLLTQMASYAITNGVDMVVCFDEIIQTPSVRTYENDTKVIVVLPIAYGQEGARGAHIKSVNGKITAELFDTSSL